MQKITVRMEADSEPIVDITAIETYYHEEKDEETTNSVSVDVSNLVTAEMLSAVKSALTTILNATAETAARQGRRSAAIAAATSAKAQDDGVKRIRLEGGISPVGNAE